MFDGGGRWSLDSPNGYPRLYLSTGSTGLTLTVDSTLWGIEIQTYLGDPDAQNTEVLYDRQ